MFQQAKSAKVEGALLKDLRTLCFAEERVVPPPGHMHLQRSGWRLVAGLL